MPICASIAFILALTGVCKSALTACLYNCEVAIYDRVNSNRGFACSDSGERYFRFDSVHPPAAWLPNCMGENDKKKLAKK